MTLKQQRLVSLLRKYPNLSVSSAALKAGYSMQTSRSGAMYQSFRENLMDRIVTKCVANPITYPCGVYAFFVGKKCLYVGSSKRLDDRVGGHFARANSKNHRKANPQLYRALKNLSDRNIRVKVYKKFTIDYIKEEVWWHDLFKPYFNGHRPYGK